MSVCSSSNIGWQALGTFIYVSDGNSPPNWTKVAKVDNIDGPGGTTDKLEVTTHDAIADGFKKFLLSLSDGGTCTLTLVYDPTDPTHAGSNFASLYQAFTDKQNRQWKVVWPTSPPWKNVFCAGVDGYKTMQAAKDALRASVTLKVSGAFVPQAGS